MLSTLINRPCTLRISTGETDTDGLGNEYAELDDVETVCELQQLTREEEGNQGELSDTGWRAFFLPAEEMGDNPTGNQLVVDGDVYEFVGAPEHKRNPRTQLLEQWEVTLRHTGTEESGS